MADSKFSANNLIAALNKREDALLNDALTAWLNCPLPELKAIATEFSQNEELAAAIEKNLNAPRAGQKEDYLCKWFYHWYQIDSLETRRFVLRYIPQLIWIYLYNTTNNETPPGVEACLLCVYNQEVVARCDMEIIFHPPTLSLPSYLHKTSTSDNTSQNSSSSTSNAVMLAPPALVPGLGPNASAGPNPNLNLGQSSTLTENALRQFNKQVKSVTVEKALKPIDLATSANRDTIIRIALQKYNDNISLFSPRSWTAYCKMCKRLVNFGFDFTITPLPLLKSKSFSKKYIEEDMDNLVLDSDEDLDDLDDDFGDELSDSDGETKLEKGESSAAAASSANDEEAKKKAAAKTAQPNSPGTPGTPRRRAAQKKGENSPKIPPLNFSPGSSPGSTPTGTPKGVHNATAITQHNEHNGDMNNNNSNNNNNVGEISTPKNAQKPPIRIILSPSCLQEMKKIFKESYKEHALKAVRKIHLRACYDLMPEIILSANALLHLEFQDRNKNAPAIQPPGKTTPRGGVQIV